MKQQPFTINSKATLQAAKDFLIKEFNDRKWLQITPNYDKQRTGLQNKALHVYCGLLAEAMNDAGFGFVIIVNRKETECNWTMERVKDFMWIPCIQLRESSGFI